MLWPRFEGRARAAYYSIIFRRIVKSFSPLAIFPPAMPNYLLIAPFFWGAGSNQSFDYTQDREFMPSQLWAGPNIIAVSRLFVGGKRWFAAEKLNMSEETSLCER